MATSSSKERDLITLSRSRYSRYRKIESIVRKNTNRMSYEGIFHIVSSVSGEGKINPFRGEAQQLVYLGCCTPRITKAVAHEEEGSLLVIIRRKFRRSE